MANHGLWRRAITGFVCALLAAGVMVGQPPADVPTVASGPAEPAQHLGSGGNLPIRADAAKLDAILALVEEVDRQAADAVGKRASPFGTTIRGRVLDRPEGKPAADATVTLWHSGDGANQTAQTDKDGQYAFTVAASEYEYVLRVTPAGAGVWVEGVGVKVGAEDIQAEDLYLVRPQGLSGTVRDTDGRAVAGATINFSTTDAKGNRAAIETDEKGRYRLYVVPRKVALNCDGTHDRYYGQREDPEKTVTVEAGQEVGEIDFTVRSAPPFTGEVVHADGKPGKGVQVDVEVRWSALSTPGQPHGVGRAFGEGSGTGFRLKTDEEGKLTGYLRPPFRELEVDGWKYRMTLKAIAWTADRRFGGVASAKTETDAPDPANLKITLAETGGVTVRVLGSDGRFNEDAELNASNIQAGYSPRYSGTVKHLGQGRYRMDGLIPGLEYYLSAKARAYRPEWGVVKKFTLNPGQAVDVGVLTLTRWSAADIPAILSWLKAGDSRENIDAAEDALATLGREAKETAPAVVELLKKTKSKYVRLAAIRMLVSVADATVLPDLRAFTTNFDLEVRRAAAEAMRQIEKPAAPRATQPAAGAVKT